MFDPEFYPTPLPLIERMTEGLDLNGKTILEPSAGNGNIVDFCMGAGAHLLACELNPDLRKIVESKCKVIADDFLTVKSEQVSHIDFILMNPPFSNGEKHLLHAYNIAPAGCTIICLLNANTLKNTYSGSRKELKTLIDAYGYSEELTGAFADAERKTNVDVALIRMTKPGGNQRNEFQGFFMDGDPEEEQANGLISYNVIRDIVNRYTKAVMIYDEQLDTARRLNDITGSFFTGREIGFQISIDGLPAKRAEFKKDLQKSAWNYIFQEMKLSKFMTKGVKDDLNKFVESQQQIPFTMKNIYRMLEIVIATRGQQMDKAVEEVFDNFTKHYHENRYNVEGWKTNSHFLLNKKFIVPYAVEPNYSGKLRSAYGHYRDKVEDLTRVLCFITGANYDNIPDFSRGCDSQEWGQWFDWGFFRVKGFKKGSAHFEFKDENTWAMFNQHVSRIKGFPLYEKATTTKSEEKRREQKAKAWEAKSNPKTQNSQNDKRNPIIDQLIKEPINSETILNMFTQ